MKVRAGDEKVIEMSCVYTSTFPAPRFFFIVRCSTLIMTLSVHEGLGICERWGWGVGHTTLTHGGFLISKYFSASILKRISGALVGAVIFFIISNFGVWTMGSYGYSLQSFILCYTIAIPFFAYSLISTFIFSGIIETVYKFYISKKFFNINQ